MRLSLDEQTALKLVLEFVTVKDLLTSAMHYFAESEDVRSKDNADLCFKAITTFLKWFQGLSTSTSVWQSVYSLDATYLNFFFKKSDYVSNKTFPQCYNYNR